MVFPAVEFDVTKVTDALFTNHCLNTLQYPLSIARSRIFVSGLLDEHRADCERCDQTLKKMDVRTTRMSRFISPQSMTNLSKIFVRMPEMKSDIDETSSVDRMV